MVNLEGLRHQLQWFWCVPSSPLTPQSKREGHSHPHSVHKLVFIVLYMQYLIESFSKEHYENNIATIIICIV